MAISVTIFRRECSGILQMRLLAGEKGAGREIAQTRAHEAGLAITGETFPLEAGRVKILGEAEIAYFLRQDPGRQAEIADRFFAGASPCAIVSSSMPVPPQPFIDAADRHGMPLFSSALPTADLNEEIHKELHRLFRESTTVHGVLMDVLGVGVLLVGRSGVGKSECALDLILRGSRFVADDIILVEKLGPATLVGGGNELTQHHMEIRGLGILNIRDLFGLTATDAGEEDRAGRPDRVLGRGEGVRPAGGGGRIRRDPGRPAPVAARPGVPRQEPGHHRRGGRQEPPAEAAGDPFRGGTRRPPVEESGRNRGTVTHPPGAGAARTS